MGKKAIKKGLLLITAALCVNTVYMNSLYAQEGGQQGQGPDYLQIIAQNTTAILEKVNTLPEYMNSIVQFALNIEKSDDSESTSQMQSNFANVGNLIVQDYLSQVSAQTQLNADLLANVDKNNMPYANDLVYSSLLGQPFFTPDPRTKPNQPAPNFAYGYVKNASGISLGLEMPRTDWKGKNAEAYKGYYDTLTSIKSFNAYVLSQQLIESQNGHGLTTAQLALVTQASSSDWIAQVATQELGKVFRQILIFQSQTYVLLTQMMQTQKQLLAAQVMTNAMLMANNKGDETQLINRARSSN